MGTDAIRDAESLLLERELTLLDNVRWALKGRSEDAWDVITKMMQGKTTALSDLHDGGVL